MFFIKKEKNKTDKKIINIMTMTKNTLFVVFIANKNKKYASSNKITIPINQLTNAGIANPGKINPIK